MGVLQCFFGARGHFRSVHANFFSREHQCEFIVVSENSERIGWLSNKLTITESQLEEKIDGCDECYGYLCIGANQSRKAVFTRWMEKMEFPSLTSPAAQNLNSSDQLGAGTLLFSNSYVGPNSRISEGVIVNTASVIEHDCVIGRFSHVGPGAVVCGGVSIGDEVLIGAGAVVAPNSRVPSGTLVKAGERWSAR